jgi:hypothetical protein
MKDTFVPLYAAGQTIRELNKEKTNLRVYRSQARATLRKEHDPEKRKKLLKKIDELNVKIDAIPNVTPTSLGMPKMPKGYFKY